MKKLITGKVLENVKVSENIFSCHVLVGDIVNEIVAGQFCSLYVNAKEYILPRPISICDIDMEKKSICLVFAILGKGTEIFSKLKIGDTLKMLMPLGNGFSIDESKKNIAIVGGGIGIPPLNLLAKNINKIIPDANIHVFLGYRNLPFLQEKFKDYNVHIASDSGAIDFHGNVVQLMESINQKFDICYACGPKNMLAGLEKYCQLKNIPTQLSLEERMACSIGACVGCVVKINGEYKKVCVDGPVFVGREVNFDE